MIVPAIAPLAFRGFPLHRHISISATGQINATGTIGGGNVTTNGVIIATGNISTSANLIANGNIAVLSAVKRTIFVSNAAPTSGQGSVGDIWYQTY